MKITIIILWVIGIVAISLFIGKTSIIDGRIHIERPISAILALALLISCFIESKS